MTTLLGHGDTGNSESNYVVGLSTGFPFLTSVCLFLVSLPAASPFYLQASVNPLSPNTDPHTNLQTDCHTFP